MDVLYERNVVTLLTTIISNIITIVLLGISVGIKTNDYSDEELLKERDDIENYVTSFFFLFAFPLFFIVYAASSLSGLIRDLSVGIPYKYIRVLSDARYFIGYDSKDKFDKDQQSCSENNCSQLTEDDKTNTDDTSVDRLFKFDSRESDIDGIRLPTLWLPKYWPERVKKVKRPLMLTLPDKRYISDPTFDGMYSVKSSKGCLFGVVQCVSGIAMSCMRLQQSIDMMHTMDVVSMLTSYFLLCIIIAAACNPGYYCKPVVCIPRKKLKIYQKLNNKLSYPELRLRIHSFFDKDRAIVLILILLSIPICLMAALLVYINKNNTLLLALSVVWVLVTTVFESLVILLFNDGTAFVLSATATLGLFTTLLVCSCLNATPEQKYPSSASWLPHF
jgi:hypothetical protein